MILKFNEFITEAKKIDLTIDMLRAGKVPEVNNPYTEDQAKKLADYLRELDGDPRMKDEHKNFVGKTPKEVARLINDDPDFDLENLQHCITGVYGDKYNGVY
jgi:hypothetical protein